MNRNLCLVLTLAASLAGNHLYAQGPQGGFTPRNGFGGPSQGNGSLRLLLGRPRPFHVDSYGFSRPDGTFQLDQTITFQGRAPMNRTWVMTSVGPNQFAATLTDAAGTVTGRNEGDRTTLRYRYKGPLIVHQTLQMRPDGRTIDNRGKVTLLGIPIARLQETIVHGN